MAKAKPNSALPKAKADKLRDQTLTRMLKTPPKLHKDEPKKGVVARGKPKRDA